MELFLKLFKNFLIFGGMIINKKIMSILLIIMIVSIGTVFASSNEVNLNLTVQHEHKSDNIEPTILIKDMDDKTIYFNKTKDGKLNKINFTVDDEANDKAKFNVTITSPGYKDKSVIVTADKLDDKFISNMIAELKAKDNYNLGRAVAEKANSILGGFNKYDKILFLTTGGYVDYKGQSTEVAIDAVINYAQTKLDKSKWLSTGNGNLFLLRERNNGPLNFFFVGLKSGKLSAVSFLNGSLTPSKVNGKNLANVREDMSRSEWNNLQKSLGNYAFPVASISNAWAKSGSKKVDTDLLSAAASHGHVCLGTISGYAMSQTLLKHYPPGDFSTEHPTEKANYLVIGVPGESEDDSLMHFLDATPGKSSYVGVNTTGHGASDTMTGFLVWDGKTNTGDLIIMSFDKDKLRAKFNKETGKVTELEFNSWLLEKLAQDPQQLVKIEYTFKGLNASHRAYIAGLAKDTEYKYKGEGGTTSTITIPAQPAHGLELNTIKSWNLPPAEKVTNTFKPTKLSESYITKIGNDAAKLAKEYFKKVGIDLGKDRTNLLALTSAGYVKLNNTDTTASLRGIEDQLGLKFSRGTLLSVHQAFWKPLWFSFIYEDPNGKDLHTLYMYYNTTEGKLKVAENTEADPENPNGKYIHNLGVDHLDNETYYKQLEKTIKPAGFGSIHPILTAWHNDPQYSMLLAYLFHNHVCPGVSPGYGITEYIFKEYPVNDTSNYIYVGNTIYCKDDALISRLGVSPGLGTYYSIRLPENQAADGDGSVQGLLIVWDKKTNTGKVHVISYQWPEFDTSTRKTRTGQRAEQIAGFVKLSKGITPENLIKDAKIWTKTSKPISEKELQKILSGADNDLMNYINSLPNTLPEKPNDPNKPNSNEGSTSNTNIKTNSSTSSSTNTKGTGISPGTTDIASVAATLSPSAEGDSAKDSNAYEVEKTQPTNKSNNSLPVTVLSILVILALIGLGYVVYSQRKDN